MIWILGCQGMLGTELGHVLSDAGIAHVGTDRDCDVTEPGALRQFASAKGISWIVNCSSYTNVDRAEDEPELAYRINAVGARNAAAVAREVGARCIYISTDYVFGGLDHAPYREDSTIDPSCIYGRTKAAGEAFVRSECAAHYIIRTAWLYGRYGGNFVKTMIRMMNERSEIGVVADQWGSPTWAYDLAQAVVTILRYEGEGYGTYHYTNEGEITWYHFACEILEQSRRRSLVSRQVELKPLTSGEFASRVKRPAYSVLSKRKVREVFGCATPHWNASLAKFIDILADKGTPQQER